MRGSNRPLVICYSSLTAFCACYVMFTEYINYFSHIVTRLVGLQVPYLTQLVVFFGIAMLAFACLIDFRRAASGLVLPVLVLCMVFITWFRLGANACYVTDSVLEKLLLYCIPTYLAVYLVSDFRCLFDMLRKFSFFLLLVEILTVLLMTTNSPAFVQTDYQGISYGLMIPLIFWVCKPKRTVVETVCLLAAFFIMVFFGGRGPLACVLLCVVYRMLLESKRRPWQMVLLCLMAVTVILFYENILRWIIYIMEQYGFSGSIVKYAELGNIFSLSGRDNIQQYAMDIISDHFLIGVGTGGTRYWLGVYGFKFGNYPHSIILEFLCDYGVVWGTVLFVALCFACVRVFRRRSQNQEAYALFEICFFSTGFLVLLFSSSYLFCPLLFAMLAVMKNFYIKASVDASRPKNNPV